MTFYVNSGIEHILQFTDIELRGVGMQICSADEGSIQKVFILRASLLWISYKWRRYKLCTNKVQLIIILSNDFCEMLMTTGCVAMDLTTT